MPSLLGWSFACFLKIPLMALESDRQETLEVNANSTDGTLGDGITTLRGNVEIRQGTLHITADEAEVNKIDGKVGSVTFRGHLLFLNRKLKNRVWFRPRPMSSITR